MLRVDPTPGVQERDRLQIQQNEGVSKTLHETERLSFDGAVDADGHILEPPDLWETYIEPKYRDRALRLVRDENGLEEADITKS